VSHACIHSRALHTHTCIGEREKGGGGGRKRRGKERGRERAGVRARERAREQESLRPSPVFICQKTKYFSGRRQLQGKRACGVSPVIELQQAHRSTAFLSLSKALAHDSAATRLKMFQ